MGRMKSLGVPIAVAVAITAAAADVRIARGQQLDTAAVRIILEQHLGRRVSQQEILAHLRRSGMSREEARAQLRARGYDPAVADQYYDQLEAGAGPPADADAAFLRALERIGLARPQAGPEAGPPVAGGADTQAPVPAAPAADSSRTHDESVARSVEADSLPYFGRNLFARSDTEFEPILVGPAPPDYRLGPGDQIVLVLTGDVQDAYEITVSRSGNLVIPNAGQIAVNGLTLAQLEDQLYDRLGSVYAGVQRGAEATTRFSVSLGNLRTIQVYILGDVERPGAVTVSSIATVFNALYHAGGPSEDGSFRDIQVRRAGSVIQEVDLYDYLVYGDSRSDSRLEHGDIVYVPLARRRVTVMGEIVRPAIYEVREDEGLRDVIEYAGGLEPDAFLRSVQIDRILPPAARQSGVERVIHNVNVESLSGEAEPIALNAGDVIEVFAVSDERRHRVTISGEVRRPGTYAWQEGTTLWGVIGQAEGLSERAYTRRAHIYRLNEEDGSRQLIRTPLLADGGTPVGDLGLADADSVVIFSRERLRNPAVISIDGLVKEPGSFPLAEGMTLQDLILSAGGFEEGANVLEAEIARLPEGLARLDTTAYVVRVPLPSAAGPPDGAQDDAAPEELSFELARRPAPGEVPAWRPAADEFELRHGDRVFIRRAPGYEPTRMVAVTGEVMLPGGYALETRRERLLSVLDRTGGLTEQAYPQGLRVVRDGKVVAIDVVRARGEPSSGHNLVLEAGDSIHVPTYDPTVIVAGAVNFESRVLYQTGEGLDYYVSQSGGYRDDADAGRVTITYQNGAREDIDKFLFFSSKPEPAPGSTIFVPFKPEAERQGLNVDQFLSRMTAIVSTLVAVIVATR